MKKCTTIVLSLLLCLVMILSACGEVNTVASIAFLADLKTTYEVGEKLEDITITVTMKDKTTATISSSDAELKITGFDTSKVGSGKLVATYKGATVEANYTVVAKVEVAKVGTEAELKNATGNIQLTAHIILTETWTIKSGNYSIDLNGNNITLDKGTVSAKNHVILLDGSVKMEIKGNGTIENKSIEQTNHNCRAVGVLNGASFTLTSGDLKGEYGIEIAGDTATSNRKAVLSTVTINGGSVTAVTYGIFIKGLGATLNINNGTVKAENENAISGNGSRNAEGNLGGTTINISGGKVESTNDAAIYLPQAGTVTISGGEISGNDAIQIKSGSLYISGGELTGRGNYVETVLAVGSGSELSGSAITITSNSAYAQNIVVSISGGKFTSTNGYALSEHITIGDLGVTKIEINNGTFSGSKGQVKINGAQAVTTVTATGVTIVK